MDLDVEEFVFAIKIINYNVKLFAKKAIMALVFEINSSGIYTAIALMNQDITILFQIVELVFKIWCFRTIVVSLIPRFVDIVTKEQ